MISPPAQIIQHFYTSLKHVTNACSHFNAKVNIFEYFSKDYTIHFYADDSRVYFEHAIINILHNYVILFPGVDKTKSVG
jgi:hypothetical protein